MAALIIGLNITYDEDEKRGFLKLKLVALLLTLVGIVGVIIAVGLVAASPALIAHLQLGAGAETWVLWLRWPVLVGGFMLGLAVLYRFAPSRDEAQWKWLSWGAATAAVLWLIASGPFSFYVSRFGSYDKTYGTLGAVVIFLFWLYLSAFVVLLGAELNAEMEKQMLKDTTAGQPEPLDRREAEAADIVGRSRERRAPRGGPKPQRMNG